MSASPSRTHVHYRDAVGSTCVHWALTNVEQTEQLIQSLGIASGHAPEWGRHLQARTGGNPQYILHFIQAIDGGALTPEQLSKGNIPDAPEQTRQLVLRHLCRLSPQARQLAQIAMVAGQSFTPELAAQLMRVPVIALTDPWHELDEQGVIRAGRFTHDLWREAGYVAISEPLRRQLHREVAAALQLQDGAIGQIAGHWELAQEWLKAGESFRSAATQAQTVGSRLAQVELLGRAITCLDRAGAPLQALECADERFHASIGTAETQRHRTWLEDLHDRSEKALRREVYAHALAAFALADQQYRVAWQSAVDAEQAFLESGDRDRALRAGCIRLQAASRLGLEEDVDRSIEAAGPSASSTECDESSIRWSLSVGTALMVTRTPVDAEPWIERAAVAAEEWGDPLLLKEALVARAACACDLNQLEASTAHYERAVELSKRTFGHGWLGGVHDMALARQYRELGRFGEALDRGLQLLERHEADPQLTIAALTRMELAVVYWRLGQPHRSMRLLRSPPPASAAPSAHAGYLLIRAHVSTAKDHRSAVSEITRAIVRVREEGGHLYEAILLRERSFFQRPECALSDIAECEEICREHRIQNLQLAIAQAKLRAYLMLGQGEEAAREARRLVGPMRSSPYAVASYVPAAWWQISEALFAVGELTEAREAWTAARHWIVEYALPNVPAEFQDSFLSRNPINAAILAAARHYSP